VGGPLVLRTDVGFVILFVLASVTIPDMNFCIQSHFSEVFTMTHRCLWTVVWRKTHNDVEIPSFVVNFRETDVKKRTNENGGAYTPIKLYSVVPQARTMEFMYTGKAVSRQ
jgi:hypothetical protein